MSKIFIFCIGGSGSRVVRALDMLMASGVPQMASGDQVYPIMIDYDLQNGDTNRSVNCVQTYHHIHEVAYPKELAKNAQTDDGFFHTPMSMMRELGNGCTSGFTMQFDGSKSKTFEDAIGFKNLGDNNNRTKDLLYSLYDSSNSADSELKIDMTVGFKGNPNIGSVVFHSLREMKEFEDFSRNCDPTEDKVILVGSIFGGTGASGIPELVNAIRETPKLANVQLGVIMILPYFSFESAQEIGTVKGSLFDSKTRASLSFYVAAGLNERINSIYYVGDNERTKMPYVQGGSGQLNDAHIVDLLGAISILHFVKRNNISLGNKFKYRMHDNEVSHEPGLSILNFYRENINDFIKPLTTMAFAVKFMESEILNETKCVKEQGYYHGLSLNLYINNRKITNPASSSGNEYSRLHDTLYQFQTFCSQFKGWIKEMESAGNHKLVLFDFNAPIEALVKDAKLTLEKKPIFGNGTSEKALVDPKEFSDAIQRHYHEHYSSADVAGKLRVDDKTAGFAFIDSLMHGVEAVLRQDNIAKILKFT